VLVMTNEQRNALIVFANLVVYTLIVVGCILIVCFIALTGNLLR